MKKAAIISAAIVVVLVIAIVLSASVKTRKLDADYELSFTGRTAVCKATVTGENKNDFIQVTMRLKRGDIIWKTWYQEGYFQISMKETCGDLLKGKLYTLEISSVINGKQQPVVSTSRTCPGSTQPTTQPTVPSATQPTVPTTQPTVPPTTQPTVPPTTQPTQPTEPAPPIQLSTDWVTDREIVPFEDRFEEDVPFGDSSLSWLVYQEGNEYLKYSLVRGKGTYPLAIQHEGETIYEIACDRVLSSYGVLGADGRWAYLKDLNTLIRLDLLTGESTILAQRNEGDIRWSVSVRGKDTAHIYQLDAERNLRIYYRDLHSDAERTLYQGVLPDIPTSEHSLNFYASATTQGQVSWQMRNPAFEEVYQREQDDPNSPCKGSNEAFDIVVQNYYNIPILARYYCDFHTGALTADFGIMDSCWYGTSWGHNHFDYEITKEETPEILDVAPVELPELIKHTGTQPSGRTGYIYSEFGYYYPYYAQDGVYTKIADIPVIEMKLTPEYAYCITTEQTIVQLSYDGSICNTIYTSDSELAGLFYWNGCLYFIDGSTIICIDTFAGTYRPVLRTTLKEIYLIGEYMDCLYFGIRQGLYCQEYTFDVDTGVLEEESYI